MKVGGRKGTVLLLAVLIVGVSIVYLYNNSGGRKNGVIPEIGNTFALEHPALAQAAGADTSFLDEEAGIALYLNVSGPIDLSKAKTVYRTIEKETVNYTVGSIALPNLPESEDVHCFVHKEGWIVVYYLKAEPVGKIIDWSYWSNGQLTKNKLQVGLEQMCNALGVLTTGVKYYHFQYPYANKCMLVIETIVGSGEDTFTITIPVEFTVYERSWSHYSQRAYPSYFKIDGTTINSISSDVPLTKYGTLTVAQLSPGVVHTVSISGYYSNYLYGVYLYGVCIALVYQEP
ncbi:MAG: hypothetical protein QXU46_02200 [Candidatus Bathyarchaeia archaeon]